MQDHEVRALPPRSLVRISNAGRDCYTGTIMRDGSSRFRVRIAGLGDRKLPAGWLHVKPCPRCPQETSVLT